MTPRSRANGPLPSRQQIRENLHLAEGFDRSGNADGNAGPERHVEAGRPADRSQDSRKIGASPMTIVPLIVVAAMMAGPILSPR